jgi:poly-gamma-glutamate synthesis protein (capsule biosynthesis protein)
VYALVAPFPTVTDGVILDELQRAWREDVAPAPFNGTPLLMDESTLAAFRLLWGEPIFGAVRTVPPGQLLETAWKESAWAIIPFEKLDPKWKVLTIDGQSPFR